MAIYSLYLCTFTLGSKELTNDWCWNCNWNIANYSPYFWSSYGNTLSKYYNSRVLQNLVMISSMQP